MREWATIANAATARETVRIRHFYEKYAASYDYWMDFYDRALLGDERRRLCARATGNTLEIAIGTGLNLAHYPSDVRLTGIDLSPAMLAVAEQRAQRLRREVALCLGDAQALEFPPLISTQSFPCSSSRQPQTTGGSPPKLGAFSSLAGSCCCLTTFVAT